jgi:hypothetical protein
MAEYQCEFPASNLDQVREVIKAVSDLRDWLCSPEARIGFERSCVVSGIAGSGKTHGICDAAIRRLEQRRLSCVVFGHEFASDPDLWTRLRESLEFSPVVGMDALLDALNAAAEATGEPLILFLDAINETRPLSYWRERLSTLVHGIESREFLRLCVTCRSSFIPYSVPIDSNYVTAEHRGFQGIEHRACEAFLQHFGLEPLVSPIIQPELANPLYLKLICSTARAQKLNRLPAGGWHFIRQ